MKRSSNLVVRLTAVCLVAMTLLSGCTGTKFLKDGESFYTGADIEFDTASRVRNRKAMKKRLEPNITPKPNTKVLGSRPGVWFYYIAGTPKKNKGFRYWVKTKLGQAPVLLTDVKPEQTAKQLTGRLNNNGFFDARVRSLVVTRGKKSKAIYTVFANPPYRLDTITYPVGRDSVYKRVLALVKEKTLLERNQRFSLERLQTEQLRIEELLQDEGFYYFDDRYLLFEADSTVGKRKVNIDLKLEKDIPDRAKRIYRIGEVNIYPNYTLSLDSVQRPMDTIQVKNYHYIDNRGDFRPEIITRVINLEEGNIYSRNDRELTLSHLMSLGTFKFVNIKFVDVDSFRLDANIYLTPLLKKSIRMEAQAVSKSNNFVGPGFLATFTNRNFLRGAELFQLKLNTAYESQISRQQSGALNSYEVGIEASLTVPRFITPVYIPYKSRKYLPQTQFKVGYNLQQRISYFRLNSFTGSFGYTWRESAEKQHTFYPIDVTYVQLSKTSLAFDSILMNNRVLASAFENQFIPGLRYSYTLNTQLREKSNNEFTEANVSKSNFYFNANIDFAGNLLHAYHRVTNKGETDPYQIFSSPYSQYVRGDVDFRYYFQMDTHNKVATRLVAGVAYAYGNSTTVPYIKQYSIGGTNSIRAFPARSIGPGTYNVRTDENFKGSTYFIDQRADIKLEGNLEFRFDIIKAMKGAVFLDAGNIWLIRQDSTRSGGQFGSKTFLKELAVGTGAGLRFDFSFFVLRFDLGIPLRKPYLPPSERWVAGDIDFRSKNWRKENLLFNIAIGYPF